jgi:uncharacterized protein (TIGR03067 family)
MTRFALLCVAVLVSCAAAPAEDKKDIPKELAPFQGTWKIIDAVADGKPAPKDILPELQFTFEGAKLTVTEKGNPETGSYSVDPKQKPATIDLVNPKGEKALGIYEFDKDGKLTICFNKGKDAARPKGYDDKDAVKLILEKVKK